MSSNGKPYGPERYKQIVRERYLISKNMNTSYSDTGYMTPTERAYLLEFVVEDLKAQQKAIQAVKARKQ